VVRTREGWREMSLEDSRSHSKGRWRSSRAATDRDGAGALRGATSRAARALGEAEEGRCTGSTWSAWKWWTIAGAARRVEGFFETGETSVMVVKGERSG
jgi:hypothetical protein